MARTQLTLIQLDNYGPWTVTPHPRPEVDLQTLQSRLYADLSQLIGRDGGYVFYTRFDNMIAVTNALDMAGHERIQESVRNRYPVTISLTTGVGDQPDAALSDATERLQAAGSAQDSDRREILGGDIVDPSAAGVQVAHFDVNSATERYTDQLSAFSVYQQINRGYVALADHMLEAHGALTFFVGGDNVISVTPDLTHEDFQDAVEHVQQAADIELRVGVDSGATATEAGMGAKEALEHCRESGEQVALGAEPAAH